MCQNLFNSDFKNRIEGTSLLSGAGFYLSFLDIDTRRETCANVERINLFNFINGRQLLFQNISTMVEMFKRDGNSIYQSRFVSHHTFLLFYDKFQPFMQRKLISRSCKSFLFAEISISACFCLLFLLFFQFQDVFFILSP